MLWAFLFMASNVVGYVLSLTRGPFWGLLVFINVYINSPRPYINWWANYLPFHNWSMVSMAVVVLSILIHKDKLPKRKLHSINWLLAFLLLSFLITTTIAVLPDKALEASVALLSFFITAYCFVKGVRTLRELRLLYLAVIILVSNLSMKAIFSGKRINARLENIGPVDSFGSNEFGLLLTAVIPLVIPFLLKGERVHKVICLFSLPLLLNALILCNSRGSIVAFVAATFFVFVVCSDKLIRKYVLLGGMMFVPAFIYLADDAFFQRISTLLSTQEAMQSEQDIRNLSSGRTEIWAYGVNMANDYPLGAGPQAFKHLARFYMPDEVLSFHPGGEYGVRSAHNTYLQIMVEQGYLGLILFLLLCAHTYFLIITSFHSIKNNENLQFEKYALFALALALTSTLLGGLFASRLYYEYFWWIVSFVVITYSCVSNFTSQEVHLGSKQLKLSNKR